MRDIPFKTLRDEVIALPPGERLEYALYLIDELTGRVDETAQYLRDQYGLTPAEARIVAVLNAASPDMVAFSSLYVVMPEVDDPKSLLVQRICHIRKKLPVRVHSVWAEGYSMPQRLDIPASTARTHSRENWCSYWTAEDVEDLRRMIASGSDISAIAEELGRTERGVVDIMRKLVISLAG